MSEEFTPEPAAPRKQNHARIEYPCAVTYFREEMSDVFMEGRNVSEHTRIHVDGFGHMSIGTAKGLCNALLACVRKAEADDQERANERERAAQTAETENAG